MQSGVAPAVSVLIPWRDRMELSHALIHNRSSLLDAGAEVIVIASGGDVSDFRDQLRQSEIDDLRGFRFEHPFFNKSLSLNLAASRSRSNKLFLLDADVLLEETTIKCCLEALSQGNFVTIDRVAESNTGTSADSGPCALRAIAQHLVLSFAGSEITVEINRVHLDDGTRSAPGLLLADIASFVQIGGMRSILSGWGWEDIDLIIRLQKAAGLSRACVSRVTHMTHDDFSRDFGNASNRFQSEDRNAAICMAQYKKGQFLGTYQQDCEEWESQLEQVFP